MILRSIEPLRTIFFGRLRGPLFPKNFSAKIEIEIQKGNFTVKTINSPLELEEVLELRYGIFHREYRQRIIPFGIDLDRYDAESDHLVIVDNKSRRIVGTYRIICSKFSNRFYSQEEFNLDSVLERPGVKLELSRACIQKRYRQGNVINLLWRGLAQYILRSQAEYLFGCGSIKTMEVQEAAKVASVLRGMGVVRDDLKIQPTPDFRLEGFHEAMAHLPALSPEEVKSLQRHLPSLFQAYLKMGAKVGAEPALDREFRCVDFLTILETAALTRLYERKYGVN